jgi:hypothetical protein
MPVRTQIGLANLSQQSTPDWPNSNSCLRLQIKKIYANFFYIFFFSTQKSIQTWTFCCSLPKIYVCCLLLEKVLNKGNKQKGPFFGLYNLLLWFFIWLLLLLLLLLLLSSGCTPLFGSISVRRNGEKNRKEQFVNIGSMTTRLIPLRRAAFVRRRVTWCTNNNNNNEKNDMSEECQVDNMEIEIVARLHTLTWFR